MAAASPFFSPLSKPNLFPAKRNPSLSCVVRSSDLHLSHNNNNNNNNNNGGFGDGGGGGSNGGGGGGGKKRIINPLVLFVEGWRSRVATDPEFPFKVLMEELVGVSATAAGDMATRPGFGLGELDLVLSTLVVTSIVNFSLMYLLAPTATSIPTSSSLPSYIFEPGPFPLTARIATLLYKGVIFAGVGFASGLAGTAITNGLLAMRGERKDSKGLKTVENAGMWAAHMGLSSNLRYQTLNGVEFALARALPGAAFRAVVVALRCLNNVAGGMSFVMLGRIVGRNKKVVVLVDQVIDQEEVKGSKFS